MSLARNATHADYHGRDYSVLEQFGNYSLHLRLTKV